MSCRQHVLGRIRSCQRLRIGYQSQLVLVLCVLSMMTGCRSQWARPASNEPSFERLLDSERKQSGNASGEPAGAMSVGSEKKRPGQNRQAASTRYGEEILDDEYSSDGDDGKQGSVEQASAAQAASSQHEPLGDESSLTAMMQRTQKAVASQYKLTSADAAVGEAADTDTVAAIQNASPTSRQAISAQRQTSNDIDFEDDSRAVMFRMTDADDDAPAPAVQQRADRRSQIARETVKPEQDSNLDVASKVKPTAHTGESADQAVTQASAARRRNTNDLSWEDHLREAIYQLEESSDVAISPEEQTRRASIARLLSIATGDIEAAMKPIDGLQQNEQEYYRHQFKALFDSFDPSGTPVASRRWSLAMLSQRKALQHLSAVSGLEVNNAAFCTAVESFGVVSEFPANNFKPDQELLLYCELDNFVSEPVKAGFETQLQGSYEIVDSNGRRIADALLPMDSHVCRNRRRDYFIAYRMYMPQNINQGNYTLKLTIEDMKGRKFGQADLAFQIVN